MPSRIALHPGHPCLRPCASKPDCFRYTLCDGPASAGSFGRGATSSSWLRSRRSPMGRTAASCPCQGRSYGQTSVLMLSSSLLRIVRAVISSPFAIKMYSLDFIRKQSNTGCFFGIRALVFEKVLISETRDPILRNRGPIQRNTVSLNRTAHE